MSAYAPPTLSTPSFNPDLYTDSSDSLSWNDADIRYLKIGGGQTVGRVETFTGGVKTDSITTTSGVPYLQANASTMSVLTPNATFGNISQATSYSTWLKTLYVENSVVCWRLSTNGNITQALGTANLCAVNATSLTATGAVTANTLTGSLVTASQPNITSVGNLSSLNVTGNLTAGSLTCTNFVQSGNYLQYQQNTTQTFATGPSVTTMTYNVQSVSQGNHGLTYSAGTFTNSSGSTKTYVITAVVTFANANTGRSIWILKNSETFRRGYVTVQADAGGSGALSTSACIVLANNDTFKVQCLQGVASATTLYSTSIMTSVDIVAL